MIFGTSNENFRMVYCFEKIERELIQNNLVPILKGESTRSGKIEMLLVSNGRKMRKTSRYKGTNLKL